MEAGCGCVDWDSRPLLVGSVVGILDMIAYRGVLDLWGGGRLRVPHYVGVVPEADRKQQGEGDCAVLSRDALRCTVRHFFV